MNHLLKNAKFLLITLTLLSCSRQPSTNVSELEKQFSTAIPIADVNQSLQVVVESKELSFEPESNIDLLIYNKTHNSVYFDNNSYVRLLVSPDAIQWLDTENGITYFGTTVASPSGTPLLDFVTTTVSPILDQTVLNSVNDSVLLRIVIIGEIMEGETRTGQNVAAYVDVTLEP